MRHVILISGMVLAMSVAWASQTKYSPPEHPRELARSLHIMRVWGNPNSNPHISDVMWAAEQYYIEWKEKEDELAKKQDD